MHEYSIFSNFYSIANIIIRKCITFYDFTRQKFDSNIPPVRVFALKMSIVVTLLSLRICLKVNFNYI